METTVAPIAFLMADGPLYCVPCLTRIGGARRLADRAVYATDTAFAGSACEGCKRLLPLAAAPQTLPELGAVLPADSRQRQARLDKAHLEAEWHSKCRPTQPQAPLGGLFTAREKE